MASIVDAALRIKDDPSLLIDPLLVNTVCSELKHRWRDRTLDPVRTLQAFALQIAHGNTAIAHVVQLCGGVFVESAYCKARQRLPVEVCRKLLRATTDKLRRDDRAFPTTWKGHRTFMTDGTGCDMPDTPLLQEHFGQSPHQKRGCGFPIASCLMFFDAASLMLVDLVMSPFATNDLSKTPLLHPHLDTGDILVGDRGFSAYVHIALLLQRGAHAVFRAHQTRDLPFPALPGPRERYAYGRHRRQRPVLVEMIATDDQIVEISKPHNRSRWLSSEQFAKIPGTLRVRVLRYRVLKKGSRSSEIILMTTLLDPAKYSAADIAALYRSRWQVEVNLRNLKQTLGMNSLHCRNVDGVMRECLMFALVYNAVCAVMGEAARRQNCPSDRISFIAALRWLRLSHGRGGFPKLKINPRRSNRLPHPRMLKRRLRFPPLPFSRSQWRSLMLGGSP